MLRKIMVLSASAGAGHTMAALALTNSLKEMGAAAEIKNIDVLDYVSPFMRSMYSRQYINLVNRAPHLLGAIYDATDRTGKFDRRRITFDVANALPFLRMIAIEKPDAIISTHFLATELAAFAMRRQRFDAYLGTVVTDFDAHAFWLCKSANQYFTALDETSSQLQQMGVSESKISVTGIPISSNFASLPRKEEAKKTLNLNAELPVVLISAGGFGVGPVEETLESALDCESEFQIVVLCGKNQKLKTKLGNLGDRCAKLVHAVGYTTNMQTYLAAADIMIGKSGGLTSSECMAAALPMLIVNPIPGQEEGNAKQLLEHGAAISCTTRSITYKLDKVINSEFALKQMSSAAKSLGRPNSSNQIAQEFTANAEAYKTTAKSYLERILTR